MTVGVLSYLDDLAVVARGLLNAAGACLDESYSGEPCKRALTHGRPADQTGCDWLTVWVDNIRPTLDGTNTLIDPTCRPDVYWRADLYLRLIRTCYPSLQTVQGKPFPTAEQLTDGATKLMIDARTLTCCIPDSLAHIIPEGMNLEFVVGALAAVAPRGGLAGWEMKNSLVVYGWSG
jgi:hypothetical protein